MQALSYRRLKEEKEKRQGLEASGCVEPSCRQALGVQESPAGQYDTAPQEEEYHVPRRYSHRLSYQWISVSVRWRNVWRGSANEKNGQRGCVPMPCELGGDRAPQSALSLGKRGVNVRGDRMKMLEGVRSANLEDE